MTGTKKNEIGDADLVFNFKLAEPGLVARTAEAADFRLLVQALGELFQAQARGLIALTLKNQFCTFDFHADDALVGVTRRVQHFEDVVVAADSDQSTRRVRHIEAAVFCSRVRHRTIDLRSGTAAISRTISFNRDDGVRVKEDGFFWIARTIGLTTATLDDFALGVAVQVIDFRSANADEVNAVRDHVAQAALEASSLCLSRGEDESEGQKSLFHRELLQVCGGFV